ncbi:hypothetical protein AB6D56_07270 [Vibrio lentus]
MYSTSLMSVYSRSSGTEVDPVQQGLLFTPVKRREIEAKHFIDLTSVDDHHGLKMMLSLRKGKLVLITGKNKGLLREFLHQRSFSKPNYYQAEVRTPDAHFSRLWVGHDNKLHACYRDTKTGNERHCILKLIGEFTENLRAEGAGFNVRVDKTPAQADVKGTPTESCSVIMLKGETPTKVILASPRELVIGEEESVKLDLRLSSNEYITSIKPCGSTLQVVIESATKVSKVRYVDAQHLTLQKGDNSLSPIVSDSPPIAFAHFNVNNSNHFANANPFIDHKIKHIGNQYVPLSGWIDSIKHRLSRGHEKWNRGRKIDAVKSFAKVVDPGLQTSVHWVKDKIERQKVSPVIMSVEKRISHELSQQEYLQSKWEQGISLNQIISSSARVYKKTDQEMRIAMAVQAGSDRSSTVGVEPAKQGVAKQLSNSTTILDQLVLGFKREHGSYDKHLKQRIISLQQRMDDLLGHPSSDVLFDFTQFASIQMSLTALSEAKSTPFTLQDLDLYLPYIERTLTNARLYLATQVSEQFKQGKAQSNQTLANKLFTENHGECNQAVLRGLASMKALRSAHKSGVRLAESMGNTHSGLGKIWNDWMGRQTPAHQITEQISDRVSTLPQGDALTLSAHYGVSGFAGVAHFGLPFSGGYFAGVVANYEKHYHCKLLSLEGNTTQIQFVRKGEKGASAIVGTGGGLEDLTKLVRYRNGSLVTLMPFEATLALTAMKDSQQSFAFDVSNDDLQKTLGYLFRTEDWQQGLETEFNKAQFSSSYSSIAKVSGSANSQFRFQLGIDASPSLSMVMPRTYVKAGIDIELSRQQAREFKLGEQTSATQSVDYFVSVDAEANSGASVMLFPLSSTHAFPIAIDEKTFVSVKPFGDGLTAHYPTKHQTTETISKLSQQSKPASSDITSQQLELLCTVIENFKRCIEKHPEWDIATQNLAKSQLMTLFNARQSGSHQVIKTIAAENIQHLKVSYEQKISWSSRWADNMRRAFHITPKHSASLGQLMEAYPSGGKMLRALRASSQSQSQMLNVDKASSVTAVAKYQMPISVLIDQFKQTLEQLDDVQDSKSVRAIFKSLNQQLNRKGETGRSLYKLSKIECMRASSLSRHPAGVLPMVKVKKLSQVMLNESLGDINFLYSEEGEPEVINRLDGSLYSVPS